MVAGCGNYGRFSPSLTSQVNKATTTAIDLPPPPDIDPAMIATLLPQDSILAIDNPQFVPVSQSQNEAMDPDEKVIGLEINGDARAYPVNILSSHEIVNDVVGGQPVAVTWCPLCYSALTFSRQLDERQSPLTFGVSGKLLQNTLIMYDRETESLWSQLYGGAIDGPLRGLPLAVYPTIFTAWSTWAEQNPNGQLLSKKLTCAQFNCGTYATNPRGSYDVDPYASYYVAPDEGVVNRQIPREQGVAEAKRRVVGVRIGDTAKAYLYETLGKEFVVNDEIVNMPIVVWFDPATNTAAAFQRTVNGRPLTFFPDPENPIFMRDRETDSQWSGLNGLAVNGRLKDTQLTPLVSTSAFEFGWFDYFPESDTYMPEGE